MFNTHVPYRVDVIASLVSSDLTASQIKIALMFATLWSVDESSSGCYSITEIQKATGNCRRTVVSSLSDLTESGVLRKVRTGGPGLGPSAYSMNRPSEWRANG